LIFISSSLFCSLRSLSSFFYCSPPPRDLHSFPTRRSSDLRRRPLARGRGRAGPLVFRHQYRRPPPLLLGVQRPLAGHPGRGGRQDRKSTRLNSSHVSISYAVFCLKKKKKKKTNLC